MKEQGFYLTPEEVEEFGQEIKSIYLDLKSRLGEEDLDIAEKYDKISKSLEYLGRFLIGTGNPLFLLPGALSLGVHYTVEFSQGHNILHGQYDDIHGNEKFQSASWKWDNTMDTKDWKYEHHVVHHPYTNVIGKDNDFGFLVYRANSGQKWEPFHLFQLPIVLSQPFINTFFFPWYVSTSRAISEKRDIVTLTTYGNSIQTIFEYLAKNYIFFPLISPASFAYVALGNYIGKIISNYHLEFILGVSHLGTEPETFAERVSETEAEFFLRQVLSTANYEVWEPTEFIYGGINTHLEHHLFPDLPPNRLKEAAPRVREVCKRFNVPYNTGSFLLQIGKLIENMIYQSLPTKPTDDFHPLELLLKPDKLIPRMIDGFSSFFKSSPAVYHSDDLFVKIKVLQKRKTIGGRATILQLEIPDTWKGLNWEAGSYISLRFKINGKEFVRQYSLTEAGLSKPYYEICVKQVTDGVVSGYVADKLQEGDFVTLVGKPKGNFVLRHFPNKNLFIAGGVGITPIISMLRKIKKSGLQKNSVFIYFNNSASEIIYHDEINYLSSKNMKIIHILKHEKINLKSKNSFIEYRQGVLTEELILDLVPDFKDRHVFICGPEKFMNLFESILDKNKFNKKNYHFENFNPKKIEIDPEKEKIFHKIKFLKSGKEISINENTSLLYAIQKLDIKIPTGCLRGMCKACQVKKISGKISSDSENYTNKITITTCNHSPRSDLELDL